MASTTITHPVMRGLFWLAVVLAVTVVVLGAYTRLSDAGLGCPDWPGCYGQLLVPTTPHAIQQADALYPSQPVEPAKAWAEMIHRYAAGTLGTLIFLYTLFAIFRRLTVSTSSKQQPIALPLALSAVVIFQAILGKWTVTMHLLPIVVMGHLLGGLTILSLLWLLKLQLSPYAWLHEGQERRVYRFWALLGLIIVILQIALGGWTSANYASLACPNFPTCNGQALFPLHELRTAFHISLNSSLNFQGGVLDSPARMTIQVMHRLGALVTTLYILWLGAWMLLSAQGRALRIIASVVIIILAAQLMLGILNVVLLLPLSIAVMHNATAAILLLALITLNYILYAKLPTP